MRTRRNANPKNIQNLGMSDIYRFFRHYFDFYLPPNPDMGNLEDRTDLYVNNDVVEEQLRAFSESEQSFCQLLIGSTGIGKSTILRNYFKLWHADLPVHEDKIIISYCCNTVVNLPDPISFFTAPLRIATDQLIQLSGTDSIDYDSLWQFIHHNKADTLRRYRPWDVLHSSSKRDDIKYLAEGDPFAMHALLLKYMLSKPGFSHIQQVILILDDVESLPLSARDEFVSYAYHAFSCLSNKDDSYHVKLLISERPHSRDDLHRKYDWREQKPDIVVNRPCSLKDLFKMRYRYAKERLSSDIAMRDKWRESHDILLQLVDCIDRHGSDFLLNLANYNVRDALFSLEYCITHGGWFQIGKTRQPQFSIHTANTAFNLTFERLLQALSYGDLNTYIESDGSRYGITNIMKNSQEQGSDLVSLLVLKWFRFGVDIDRWSDSCYFKNISNLYSTVKEIFPLHHELPDLIQRAITHFENQGILDKVRDPANTDTYLHVLMPRGIELWEELGFHSMLLQIYLDDLWLDEKEFAPPHLNSLDMPMHFQLEQHIKLCQHIAVIERTLIGKIYPHTVLQRYELNFGTETIAHHIANGILTSLRQLYKEDRPVGLDEKYKNLYSYIRETENMITRPQ